MVEIKRAEQFPVQADRLFTMFVSREGRLQIMRDYVRDIEVDGEGVGAIYRMYTAGLLPEGCVVEQSKVVDAQNGRLEIDMLDTGGVVPFADYRAGIRVQKAGPKASVLTLYSSFVPIGMSDLDGESAANRNYDAVFEQLRMLFPPGSPELPPESPIKET